MANGDIGSDMVEGTVKAAYQIGELKIKELVRKFKNRELAMKMLRAQLYEVKLHEQNASVSAQRKLMVKSGDRSDKIRTYNFPQNRVTDHRIGLTLYNLSEFIDGKIDEMIEQLKLVDKTEKLANAE